MLKILFINGNLQGHFNPTLPVVSEFVRQDDKVWYICDDLFKEKIEGVGANFISMGEELEEFYKNYKPTGEHPFYKLIEYIIKYDQVFLPIILDKIKDIKFDFICYDSIIGVGYFLKEILHIPGICSNSTFVMDKLPVSDRMLAKGFHPQLDECYSVLNQLCETWKVKVPTIQDIFMNKGDWNLVYTSREFNPNGESFDDSYLFIGPSLNDRQEDTTFPYHLLEGGKVIYISLGTINTDFNEFYKLCMKAFGDTEFKVVLAVGKKCDINELGKIPDNFIVRNYVPQLEILQRASVFISHGGFNSISEALYYLVPAIVIPLINDQHMVAGRVTDLGAGIALNMKEVTANHLKESVETILSDGRYSKACANISESFQKAGGCQKAVEIIRKLERGI
jgi:MGT family glycosyltransferase